MNTTAKFNVGDKFVSKYQVISEIVAIIPELQDAEGEVSQCYVVKTYLGINQGFVFDIAEEDVLSDEDFCTKM